MALKEVKFQAGIDKQSTPSAAAGKWVDSDFVRFRYGVPEKIGGWDQLTTANNTLPGVARAQHTFTNLNGTKFSAIGTSSGLFIFSENIVADFDQEKIVIKTDQEAEKDPEMDFDDQGSTDKVKQMAKSAMNRRK
jgi:hypothetical protein